MSPDNQPDQLDQALDEILDHLIADVLWAHDDDETPKFQAQALAALKLLLLKARKDELEDLIDLEDDSKSLPFGNSLFTNHSVIEDRIKSLDEEMKGVEV